METSKNTGLANSFLLRRTEVPAVLPDVPVVTPTQETESVLETPVSPVPTPEPTPVSPIQNAPQSHKKQPVLRDRCTLYIAQEVNELLDVAARVEGRDRSEIVTDILREHLPTFRIERRE